MNKKTTWVIILIVVVAVAGLFAFMNYEPYKEYPMEEDLDTREREMSDREIGELLENLGAVEEVFGEFEEVIKDAREMGVEVQEAEEELEALRDDFRDLDEKHIEGEITDEDFYKELDEIIAKTKELKEQLKEALQ